MTSDLRLGRILGVEVGVSWSLVVIFALVAGGLAFGRLPVTHPDEPAAAYVVVGVVGAVAFLASVLAHELAHAVVARRRGLEVEGITLWLFGGVARLGGEAADPGTELRIAAAGPLTSVAVGVVVGAAAMALDATDRAGLVVEAMVWLATLNLVLAVFNLLPGAPLDGGRVLRALLWRRSGDRVRAAVSAARAGQVLAYGLIGLGVFTFVSGGFGGLWFAFIGWFLLSAARAEEAQAGVTDALGEVLVGRAMTPQPITVPGAATVGELLEADVLRHRVSAFPVVDAGGEVTGLVTLHRLREVPAGARATTRVDAIARPPGEVATAAPEERLVDVLPRMATAEGRLLVLAGGHLVGIVSPTDVVRLVEHAELLRAAGRAPDRP